MTLVEIKDLRVSYNEINALENVSFDINAGDYIGIVGPNGSGKTTLIKAILGLIPFDGKITFQGKSLKEFASKRHIGYLPQKMTFLDPRFPATAEEIIVSGVYCCKKFPIRIERKDHISAEAAMKILGITDLKDRPIGRLSGGQQQRVLLARALVHAPDILILDEPTVALDPVSREGFYATVTKLNRERNVTVLLISHDSGMVGSYASKLLYLDRRLVFYGSFDEFCTSPSMSSYFGASQHIICHRH